MQYALGVDLGTTYSAVAIASQGKVEIVQLGTRLAAIPSAVLLRADGELLTGEAAERRAHTEPSRLARQFKRRLGDPTPLIVGGTPFGAEALTALLLRAMIDRVSEEQGARPALIAITHPASYGPFKLDLLRQAALQAGVEAPLFVPEPVAAALQYAAEERLVEGSLCAVYDFGGGTFDAALLRRTAAGFDLLGQPEGLERLGGIDFDEAVFAHVASALEGKLEELDMSDPAARAAVLRLRDDCREAKESLSADSEATIPVMLPNLQTDVRLTRGEFEEMIRPRIQETVASLERSVRSAGLTMAEVERILLVGGTSRIPLVGQVVHELTGRPVAIDAHPKHTVALGAARLAWEQFSAGPTPLPVPPAAETPAANLIAQPAEPAAVFAATLAANPHAAAPAAATSALSTPAVVAAPPSRRPQRPAAIVIAAVAALLLVGGSLALAASLSGGGGGSGSPAAVVGPGTPASRTAGGIPVATTPTNEPSTLVVNAAASPSETATVIGTVGTAVVGATQSSSAIPTRSASVTSTSSVPATATPTSPSAAPTATPADTPTPTSTLPTRPTATPTPTPTQLVLREVTVEFILCPSGSICAQNVHGGTINITGQTSYSSTQNWSTSNRTQVVFSDVPAGLFRVFGKDGTTTRCNFTSTSNQVTC